MKKILAILSVMFWCLLLCTGCHSQHVWEEATCEKPQICIECGKEQGEALGHDWQPATCQVAQTCSRCGSKQGETLAHTWKEADYENPKTCQICGVTEGEKLFTFSERNRTFFETQFDSAYKFETMTDKNKGEPEKIGGIVEITGMRIKEETENYEKKEGYEWHIANCWIEFDTREYPAFAEKGVDLYWGCTDGIEGTGIAGKRLEKNHITGASGEEAGTITWENLGEISTRSTYSCGWSAEMEGVIWYIKLEYAVLVPEGTEDLVFCLYSSEYDQIEENLETKFQGDSCLLFSMDKKGGSVIWLTASVQGLSEEWKEWFVNLDDEEQQKEIDRAVGGLRYYGFEVTLDGVEWFESMSKEERRIEILTDYARQWGYIPQPWEGKPLPENMDDILSRVEEQLNDWDGGIDY